MHEEVVELEGFFMADGGVAPVRIEELVEMNYYAFFKFENIKIINHISAVALLRAS